MVKYCISFLVVYVTGLMAMAQTKVEGIHYRAGKPVSVEMEDGKIVRIRVLLKLSESVEQCFISPGLFDNQVNGFAGVSFSLGGGELTAEGVKKAVHEM